MLIKLCWFCLLLWSATAVQSAENMALPKNKAYSVLCTKSALARHPGQILHQKTVQISSQISEIHLEVIDKASVNWLIICDNKSGSVLKEINLDEQQ